jgi:predicted acyltransferase
MTFVNAAIYLHDVDGFDVPAVLRHAAWRGVTLADAVFPAFVLAVGMSVAARRQGNESRSTASTVRRAARLALFGLLISNSDLLGGDPDAHFRVLGVLQRLALVYLAAEAAMSRLSSRTRLITAAALLALYGALLTIAPPDLPKDLHLPGHDLASWGDRVLLAPAIYVQGPAGFDPEGLLSTLAAIAQGLIGTLLTAPLEAARSRRRWALFALAGLALVGCGFGLDRWQPMVKSIWTPSFVLVSTGAASLVAAALRVLAAARCTADGLAAALLPAGRNALLIYILQGVLCDLLAHAPFTWAAALPAPLSCLSSAAAYSLLIWLLAWVAWRAGLRVRI